MNGKLHLALAAALGVTCAGLVQAQEEGEEAKPKVSFIVKDVVKPSMSEEYETAIKNMVSELAAYDIDPEKVGFATIYGPELGYVYVMPLEDGFSSMKTRRADWHAAIEKIGEERFESVAKAANDAIDHTERFHAAYREDLSYNPENPANARGEAPYIGYQFFYIMPGHMDEVEEIAKEFQALYKQHDIDVGWRVYTQITGPDLPLMVVARAAKSPADFHATSERLNETLGEAAVELRAKANAHFRRVEVMDGWARPDLSYPSGPAQ